MILDHARVMHYHIRTQLKVGIVRVGLRFNSSDIKHLNSPDGEYAVIRDILV